MLQAERPSAEKVSSSFGNVDDSGGGISPPHLTGYFNGRMDIKDAAYRRATQIEMSSPRFEDSDPSLPSRHMAKGLLHSIAA